MGFDRSPRHAPLFYGLIGAGTLGGVAISYFSNNPIGMLVLSATINGIVAAPFLVVLMVISGSKRLMGDYRNRWLATTVGWVTAAIMTAAGAAAVYIALAQPR